MNCEQARTVWLDYLLEDCPPEVRAEMDRHLEGCPSCAEELSLHRQTVALLERGDPSEEMPRRIALAAEPLRPWAAFWRNSARLAFAGGGLLCLAVALLAVSRATLTYENGAFRLAFGPAAPATVAEAPSTATQTATLDRAAVERQIAEAVAATRAEMQESTEQLVQAAAARIEQQRQQDFKALAESFRYFEANQTLMWKEQVQNQYLVSSLLQQVGAAPPPAQP